MSIIYILIPIAAVLTALGLYLFFWAVKAEQFDDLEKQGLSILFDEDKTPAPHPEKNDNNKQHINPKVSSDKDNQ